MVRCLKRKVVSDAQFFTAAGEAYDSGRGLITGAGKAYDSGRGGFFVCVFVCVFSSFRVFVVVVVR